MSVNWNRGESVVPADVLAEVVQAERNVREWERILADRIQDMDRRIAENKAILADLAEYVEVI